MLSMNQATNKFSKVATKRMESKAGSKEGGPPRVGKWTRSTCRATSSKAAVKKNVPRQMDRQIVNRLQEL